MWFLVFSGCGDPIGTWDLVPPGDTAPSGARVVASPGRIDFGSLSVNDDGEALGELTLVNLGDAAEIVTGHDEPIGSDAFSVDAAPLLSLGPGESVTLAVRYRPTTEQSDAAELLLDPSEETVRLVGRATAPVLQTGDATLDPVVVGCAGTGSVSIRNVGSESLVVSAVSVADEEFALVASPSTVDPNETADILLTFTPTGGGERGATLRVSTNDPERPEIGILVSALGYEGERVTESFRYTPSNPTDLLFVVDAGDGMTSQLDKAEPVLASFVHALRDANIDYHLAALSGFGPCPTTTPGWADRSDTSLQAESVLERGLFGAAGPWDGDLLGLAHEALEASGAGVCLAGFRRENADLQVIVLTDGPGAADTAASQAALASAVAAPAVLRVSGLLPAGGCGTPAADYAAVVASTGGVVEDLCAADWAGAFVALAELPGGEDAVRFPLAEVPVPATIEVLAEGLTFTSWTWDAVENSVVFDGEATPALGAEITIRYVSSVACG